MSGAGTGGRPARFADLPAGHEFTPVEFTIGEAALSAYLAAVGDAQSLYGLCGPRTGGAPLVPPWAVAAFALRSLAGTLALEPGAIHGGQDYEFRRPVRAGEPLRATSRVANKTR